MKISNTATDCQTSEVILREQRQICRERFFSNPGLIIGLTVFILIALAAIIIPAAVNVDPNEMAIADRLKGPSLNHPFGTDEFGRDLMIRVLYGARVSLLVGCPASWVRSPVSMPATSKSWITSSCVSVRA